MAQIWLGNAAGYGVGTWLREMLRPVNFLFRATGMERSRSQRILSKIEETMVKKQKDPALDYSIPTSSSAAASSSSASSAAVSSISSAISTVAAAVTPGGGSAAAAAAVAAKPALRPVFDANSIKIVWKEGGALIRLEGLPPNPSFQAVETYVQKYFEGAVTFGGHAVRPQVVRGTGFVEDMHLAIPTRRLKVVMQPVPLGVPLSRAQQMFPLKVNALGAPEERLFDIFRRYGPIKSIEVAPTTGPGAVPVPVGGGTVYMVNYANLARSIDAKMALNGAVIDGAPSSVLHVGYMKMAWSPLLSKAWQTITQSKFVIPVFLVGTSLATFFLINPIRVFNVTQTLTMNWRDTSDSLLASATEGDFPWVERAEEEKAFQERFNSCPSSAIVVTGESGSGKSAVISKLLRERKFAARIDCTKLRGNSASSEEYTVIDDMGKAVGFSPSFSALNTVLSYVESAMMIKQSPVSTTRESQFQTLLSTVKQALKVMSQLYPRDENKSFPYAVIVFDGFEDLVKSIESAPKDKVRGQGREKEKESDQFMQTQTQTLTFLFSSFIEWLYFGHAV